MSEPDDHKLLAEFARAGSEPAFAALVARYVNLVYSTAFRFTGNAHHSEEISQAVFIILAHKAASLSPGVVLSGWLYQTARLTAANFTKGEIRRQRREQEVYMQSLLNESNDAAWREMAPLLDEAMGRLGKMDRDAVVLRFFENKNSAEIGSALRMTEETARRRVNRALEKLRKFFSRRDVVSTTVIIAGAISANSVNAAPAGLAQSISAVAIAKGAAAPTSTLTLVKGVMKFMAWTKTKMAITAGAVLLLAAAGTTTVIVKRITERQNDEWRLGITDPGYLSLLTSRTVILPTKGDSRSRRLGSVAGVVWTNGIAYGVNYRMDYILRYSFFKPDISGGDYTFSPVRTILNTELPTNQYDFFSNWRTGAREALQAELKKKFGLTAEVEPVETNALLLTVKDSAATGLMPRTNQYLYDLDSPIKDGKLKGMHMAMGGLARGLEVTLGIPVIDQTGLKRPYDFTLSLNENNYDSTNLSGLNEALTGQLGLELVPTNMPVEMLVVEKVN